MGTAQLLQRPAEKPDAILTRARVPGWIKDSSPSVICQCSLCYGVRTATVRSRMHQRNMCAQCQNGSRKILHTLVGVGIVQFVRLLCLTRVWRK